MITAAETKLPRLLTELPGPQAKRVIEDDAKFMSPSLTREYPLVAKKGRGAIVEDIDGNAFLDFAAGIAVCSTGHCHPKVVEAIQKQAAELIHISGTDFITITCHSWRSGLWLRCPAKNTRKCSLEIPARRQWKARSSWPAMLRSGTSSSLSTGAFTAAPSAPSHLRLPRIRSASISARCSAVWNIFHSLCVPLRARPYARNLRHGNT